MRHQTARSVWSAARSPPLSDRETILSPVPQWGNSGAGALPLDLPGKAVDPSHSMRSKSGAKDTRGPDASRMPCATKLRGASGVRRVHRRFRMGETILAPVPQWGIQAQGRSRLTCRRTGRKLAIVVNGMRAAKSSIVGLLLLAAVAACSFAQTTLETNSPAFKKIKLFDLKKDGAYVFTFCTASRELFVSFVEETSQAVYRWNLDSGRLMDSYKFPKKYRCDKAVVSPDGKVLVLVAYDMRHDALSRADKVRLIDVPNGKLIKELTYDGPPPRVQFSRDGRFIVTRQYTSDPGGERVYDLSGNEQKDFDLKAFDSLDQPTVWEITNSKGGPRPGLFWRDESGIERRLYPSAETLWSDARDFFVSADTRYVACSTDQGKLMIWRLPDAKLVFESPVGKRWFHIAYDSKTGRILFADGDIDKVTSLQAIELAKPH